MGAFSIREASFSSLSSVAPERRRPPLTKTVPQFSQDKELVETSKLFTFRQFTQVIDEGVVCLVFRLLLRRFWGEAGGEGRTSDIVVEAAEGGEEEEPNIVEESFRKNDGEDMR